MVLFKKFRPSHNTLPQLTHLKQKGVSEGQEQSLLHKLNSKQGYYSMQTSTSKEFIHTLHDTKILTRDTLSLVIPGEAMIHVSIIN